MVGINITTRILAQSKNNAAIPLLEKALTSSLEEVRRSAGNQLIAVSGTKILLKLIDKFDPADETMIHLFNIHRDKIFSALRIAVSGSDPYLARNAFRVIYTQRYFELLPSMLSTFLNQDKTEEGNSSLSEGILRLLEKYVQALEERKHRRRFHETILSEIVTVLFRGLKDFHRNDPDLFLVVFLQLYVFMTDKHSSLTKLLSIPTSIFYGAIHRFLIARQEPYVFRFLVHCFEHPNPPPVVLAAFSKRSDLPFIVYFLKNIAEPISVALQVNLAAVCPIEWFVSSASLLDQLDEQAQAGLAILVQHAGLSQSEVQLKLLDLFHRGKTKGRLKALTALMQFSGDQIDQLIWDAGGDADPNIQAEALTLLAKRNIPNANFRILQFANSPHKIVRETIQKLLPNFRLSRFFEMFDQLTDEQRRSMFNVIKVLDSQVVSGLTQILVMGEPLDQAKALLCVEYGAMVLPLEDSLCGVLAKGELSAIRVKAAELLAMGRRELSRSTLVQAFHRDPDPMVQATAKRSLEKRPAPWEQLKETKK
ncbi:MAG: hypothetical protein LBI18_10940 [Planctomycetaceae bacterium]|jgi:hypothetical protein|nr:hypothetical protein [Planctomycetaceae bacterium]